MKRLTSACLAFASALVAVAAPQAARPHYGGVLRVETAATIRGLDPFAAPADATEAIARSRVQPLVFETLTRIDAGTGLQPCLALAWESDSQGTKWRFRVRPGVTLHDGSILQPWQVATALRTSESRWRVATDGDTLVIDAAEPVRDLPWRLAESAHAIAVKSGDRLLGTGPFRLERIEPSLLSLRAHDGHRRGRPFLDAVQVQLGQPLSAQLTDLEADRADLVSVQATDARRIGERGMRLVASKPLELVALVFEPHRVGPAFEAARRSFASAIDRDTMGAILLQRHGEPAAGLFPQWLSGYSRPKAVRGSPLARAAVMALPADQRELVVRVDPSDSLAQAIAERIVVDAREGGFSVKVQAPTGLAPRADARIVRLRLTPATPDRVLANLVARLGNRAVPDANVGAGLDAVYRSEGEVLDAAIVVPLVHLEELYGQAEQVMTWTSHAILPSGDWNFADVWLRSARP